jgi:ergothioneine biosynthesis protein EgtB
MNRPTTEEIYEYREYVNEQMLGLLRKKTVENTDRLQLFLELGIQHEQQHQELLLTDIKYILGANPFMAAYRANLAVPENETEIQTQFIPFEGGNYEIGYAGNGYCWDNEKPIHTVYLNDFNLRNTLVTNAEYLGFIEDGGYTDHQHWLSDGWEMVKQEGLAHPLYWQQVDGEWYEFTLGGIRVLSPTDPVTHISFYEADAFASWAGKRLPTEQEWEVAALLSGAANSDGNYINSNILHPAPAGTFQSCRGMYQLLGDAWEWTYSGYFPYPGYKRQSGALGEYNGKFMINQMVLRGGSCASPNGHVRPSYRNFFHPSKRWQFTGIRLAQ